MKKILIFLVCTTFLLGCADVHKTFSKKVDLNVPVPEKDFYGNDLDYVDLVKGENSYEEEEVYSFLINERIYGYKFIKMNDDKLRLVDYAGNIIQSDDLGKSWEKIKEKSFLLNDYSDEWDCKFFEYDSVSGQFYIIRDASLYGHNSKNDPDRKVDLMVYDMDKLISRQDIRYDDKFLELENMEGVFSDDGKYVVCEHGIGQICEYSLDSMEKTVLTEHKNLLRGQIVGKRKGKVLASGGNESTLFYVYNCDTEELSEERCLTHFFNKYESGNWSLYMTSEYSVYLVSEYGVYRHIIGTDKIEMILDGRTCLLGNTDDDVFYFEILDEEHFLIFYSSGQVMRYSKK